MTLTTEMVTFTEERETPTATCDASDCKNKLHAANKVGRFYFAEHGWLVLYEYPKDAPGETREWHFCGFKCLGKWGKERGQHDDSPVQLA